MSCGIYQCRGEEKFWGLHDGASGRRQQDSDVNWRRLYDFLNEQGQDVGHTMVEANIRHNPQQRSERH